ncbi:MAG: ATP synthase F1 subunit gamma [Bdellovibrionales bacterium]
MANTKDLRNRIASVKNTQQTTKAMKMVSAAKLRKAQHAIVNSRPYAYRLRSVISKIASSKNISHPFLIQKENPSSVLMIVLTSDRGLCGGFNSSVLKAADRYYKENKTKYSKVDVYCIGRRAGDFFRKRSVEPLEVVTNLVKDIRYGMAQALTARVLEWYGTGAYDEVQIVYNEFKSAIAQIVVKETLLPVAAEVTAEQNVDTENTPGIIFEPSPEVILDQLLEKHFAVQVYRCMQESIASEHGARMNAMENATKNAGEAIRNLTLTLNKIRQAAITTELIEITSGAEALNG